jgi:hypothetical protein
MTMTKTQRDPSRPQLRLRLPSDTPARLEPASRQETIRLLAQLLASAMTAATVAAEGEGSDETR